MGRGRWVGMKVTRLKFIGEQVDGEEFTFNLNILVGVRDLRPPWFMF
jgi:hypothetical protein